VVDDEGSTPLLMAALGDRADAVAALLSCGANVHHANTKGDTALHIAARNDFVSVLRVLLDASGGLDTMGPVRGSMLAPPGQVRAGPFVSTRVVPVCFTGASLSANLLRQRLAGSAPTVRSSHHAG
jgi:hypothetical protein